MLYEVITDATARTLASVLLVLAAIGFVAGGIGIFAKQAWWRPIIVAMAIFSSVVYLLLWNGGFQHLDNKGGA